MQDVEAGAQTGTGAVPSTSSPPNAASKPRSRSRRGHSTASKFLTRSDTLAVLNRVLANDGVSSTTGREEVASPTGGADGTNPAPANTEESPSLGQGQPLAFLQRLSERLQRCAIVVYCTCRYCFWGLCPSRGGVRVCACRKGHGG